MAGKTGVTCSPAAPLSPPANTVRRAKRAAEPAENPDQHKRSTRATHEEHKRPIRHAPAIPWLTLGLCLACIWPVPRLSLPLVGLQPSGLGFPPVRRPINHPLSTPPAINKPLPSAFVGYWIFAIGYWMSDVGCCGPHRIPKGFRLKAQGCDVPRRSAAKAGPRATPWLAPGPG
jgi:hypothetical protein